MICECPKCKRRLEVHKNDSYRCPGCWTETDFYLFNPRQNKAVVGRLLTRDGENIEAACYAHENNRAEAACERCGSFICSICVTPSSGKIFCGKCFEIMHSQGELSITKTRFANHGTQVLSAGLLSCLFGIGMFSPVVLIYGPFVYGKIRKDPRPARRGQLIRWWIGMILALASGIFFWTLLVRNMGE